MFKSEHKAKLDRVMLENPKILAQITNSNTKPINMLVGLVMNDDQKMRYDAKQVAAEIYERLGLAQPEKKVTCKVDRSLYTISYENTGNFYKDADGNLCRDPEVELCFKIKCNPFDPNVATEISKTGQEKLLHLLEIINSQIIEG